MYLAHLHNLSSPYVADQDYHYYEGFHAEGCVHLTDNYNVLNNSRRFTDPMIQEPLTNVEGIVSLGSQGRLPLAPLLEGRRHHSSKEMSESNKENLYDFELPPIIRQTKSALMEESSQISKSFGTPRVLNFLIRKISVKKDAC